MKKNVYVRTFTEGCHHIPRLAGVVAFLLCTLLTVPGCSSSTAQESDTEVAGTDAGNATKASVSSEPAGVITWSGFLSGKKVFESAGCVETAIEPGLGNIIAPFQGKHLSDVLTPGPLLSVTFMPSGKVGIVFNVNNQETTEDNSFLRGGLVEGEGVSRHKKDGNYVVTLTNVKAYNSNLENQGQVVLNGTLECTKLVNG